MEISFLHNTFENENENVTLIGTSLLYSRSLHISIAKSAFHEFVTHFHFHFVTHETFRK